MRHTAPVDTRRFHLRVYQPDHAEPATIRTIPATQWLRYRAIEMLLWALRRLGAHVQGVTVDD